MELWKETEKIIMWRFLEHIVSSILNILTLGFLHFVIREVHVQMVKDLCPSYKKASYKEFKNAFDTTLWSIRYFSRDERGFFLIENTKGEKEFISECWCSIIMFKNQGYILTSLGYILASRYIKKQFQSRNDIPLLKNPN